MNTFKTIRGIFLIAVIIQVVTGTERWCGCGDNLDEKSKICCNQTLRIDPKTGRLDTEVTTLYFADENAPNERCHVNPDSEKYFVICCEKQGELPTGECRELIAPRAG